MDLCDIISMFDCKLTRVCQAHHKLLKHVLHDGPCMATRMISQRHVMVNVSTRPGAWYDGVNEEDEVAKT